MIKLKAAQLRTTKGDPEVARKIKRNPIYIILDNVMDTYNVGAIFRLADAVAAEKVILCGQTETPPNTRIKKASINTTEWVAWSYASTAVEALQKLKVKSAPILSGSRMETTIGKKLKVIAIEQSPKSVPYTEIDYTFPVALVVGHETTGVSPEVLDMVDYIAEIPMWGINTSLNVMVSLGIVLFEVMRGKASIH